MYGVLLSTQYILEGGKGFCVTRDGPKICRRVIEPKLSA